MQDGCYRMSSGAQRKVQPVTGERWLLAWIVSCAFPVGDKFAGGRWHIRELADSALERISPMAGHGVTVQVMNTAIATNWQVAAAHTKA